MASLSLAAFGVEIFVQRFGNYDRIYCQLGAVMVFMLWLYAMGLLMVLVGVELVRKEDDGGDQPDGP